MSNREPDTLNLPPPPALMLKVTKHFTFDMAHLLDGHDGKCKNLHGHTYRLEVEVTGTAVPDGPKRGMVMDFADLKDIVRKLVVDPMDHAFAYDEHSTRESEIAALLQRLDLKVYAFPCRTTAENMSQYIFRLLRDKGDLPVSMVRLWETPTSCSEYCE